MGLATVDAAENFICPIIETVRIVRFVLSMTNKLYLCIKIGFWPLGTILAWVN